VASRVAVTWWVLSSATATLAHARKNVKLTGWQFAYGVEP